MATRIFYASFSVLLNKWCGDVDAVRLSGDFGCEQPVFGFRAEDGATEKPEKGSGSCGQPTGAIAALSLNDSNRHFVSYHVY